MTSFSHIPAGEAIDQVLTDAFAAADASVPDVPTPHGADLGAGGLIAGLRALGSGGDWARRVADLAGIDRRTVQRIAAGKSGGGRGTLARLRAAWDDQRRRVEADRRKDVRRRRAEAHAAVRARLTARGGTFKLKGVIRVSNDTRRGRTIDLGPIPTGPRERIISAWERGGADTADTALGRAIHDNYTTGMEIESVEDLTWQ